MKTQADTGKMDLWIRQMTLMAMLLIALALILMGVALYAPRAHAETAQIQCPAGRSVNGGERPDADISSRDIEKSREEAR